MMGVAIIIIIITAFIHVGWNFIGKRRNPTPGFFLIACFAGSMLLSPVFVADIPRLVRFPTVIWMWLVPVAISQTMYYVGLASAYRNGNMSIVYPLTKAYSVLLVLAGSLILGQRHSVSTQAIIGVLLVVVGCVTIPKMRFQEFCWSDYTNKGARMALLTGAGGAGYYMVDNHILKILRAQTDLNLSAVHASLLYSSLENWVDFIALFIFILLLAKERKALANDLRTGKVQGLLMGLGITVAYTLVLVAMAFARDVSYIIAFRQISIPLAVTVGVVFLHEPIPAPKVVGAITMFTGLMLVATG
jgi:drug/metabolite transporter (DMT)-like permease